jgi:type 1 fimbria pilin
MRRLFALNALIASVSLALMASTASAAPLTDHFRVTFNGTFPDTQCGIDGASVFNGLDNIQVFADGTYKAETQVNQVFTSAATGKSVLLFFAFQFVAAGPIDNGDGTLTFTGTYKGLKEKLKLPNGTILSRDAGLVTFNNTFDATTGDFLGETVSAQNGPHPDLDSGGALFCDVIVPALS